MIQFSCFCTTQQKEKKIRIEDTSCKNTRQLTMLTGEN